MMNHTIKSLISGAASILMLAGCLTSCDQKNNLPEKPEMKISELMLVFPMQGGEQKIDFETNRNWTASVEQSAVSSDVSWCRISAPEGTPGNNTLVVTVEPLDGDYREATLLLNASAAGKDIRICQTGRPVVTATEAEEITESQAKFTVSWIYSGEIEVTEIGVAIAANGSNDWEYKAFNIEEMVSGTYSQYIGGLKASTEYRFKAYVKDDKGTLYEGAEMTFTTDAEPVQISIKALKEKGREISLGGQNKYSINDLIEATVIASFNKPEEVPESKAISTVETKILVADGVSEHSGITIYLPDGENTFVKGDKLSIRLKDGTLRHDNADAVNFVPASSGALTLVSQGNEVKAATVSPTDFVKYESMYVKVENTQLTKQYMGYETWSSSESMVFEVSGSETGYEVTVPANSAIAAQAPKTGSGSIYGVVMTDGNSKYGLVSRNAEDVAELTKERFKSLLEFNYLAPKFTGSLTVGEKISKTTIDIEYRNCEGNVHFAEGAITVEVSGAGAEGITVQANKEITLEAGSGKISLSVTGTPANVGEVIFTINGIEDLPVNTCSTEVKEPVKPEIGNFDCVWNLAVAKNNLKPVTYSTNTNEASVTVSPLEIKGDDNLQKNVEGAKYSGKWGATGWNANTSSNYLTSPVQYFETSLTVNSGILDLSGLDLQTTGTALPVSVQYSVNGGAFIQIGEQVSAVNFTLSLSDQPGLTGITAGSKVTFRMLAISTNATEKWGINGSKTTDPTQRSLAIYGNVR